jgi:hypothetical protein
MVWFHFKKPFSFKPTPNSTIDYPAGSVMNVTQRCADQAEAKGLGEKRDSPNKTAKAKPDVRSDS